MQRERVGRWRGRQRESKTERQTHRERQPDTDEQGEQETARERETDRQTKTGISFAACMTQNRTAGRGQLVGQVSPITGGM